MSIAGKMEMVHESKALAVAMDIDAAGLPFLKNMEPPAGSKTVEELRQIAKMAGTPFIVKGVMTVRGALKAKEAGSICNCSIESWRTCAGSVPGDSRSSGRDCHWQ